MKNTIIKTKPLNWLSTIYHPPSVSYCKQKLTDIEMYEARETFALFPLFFSFLLSLSLSFTFNQTVHLNWCRA